MVVVTRAREKGINLQLSELITTMSEQDAGRRARWLRFRARVGMARVRGTRHNPPCVAHFPLISDI